MKIKHEYYWIYLSFWKCYLKKCIELKFILTGPLEMFSQFQNIFPFSLYHLYSASSELFIDETEKSWKVYPPCSFNSFVPSEHIGRVIGIRRCNIESSFQKITNRSPKTHPPKLAWQQIEQSCTTSLCFSWLYSNI